MSNVFPILLVFFGVASFAIIFKTPRRCLIPTVFIGLISVGGQQYLFKDFDPSLAIFILGLVISCLSNFFARLHSTSAQCFLIPGFIFLVPGAKIFQVFDQVIAKNNTEAFELALSAILITGGISLAILLANWLVPAQKSL